MKILKKLNFGIHLIKLLLNPDNNINSLIYISDQLAVNKASQNTVNELFRNKELQKMCANNQGLKQLDLEELKLYEPKSLGQEVYHFYKSNGLTVYPMKNQSELSKEVYISERVRKTHDILHVCLGYGTDLVGEAKLNAFVARQARMPVSILIICGIIIKYAFYRPFQFQKLIQEVSTGWIKGGETKNFLLEDWDELLKQDAEKVRKYLCVGNKYEYKMLSSR